MPKKNFSFGLSVRSPGGFTLCSVLGLAILACAPNDGEQPAQTATLGQMLRVGPSGTEGSYVRFDVLATDEAGLPFDCADGKLRAEVEVSTNEGKHYVELGSKHISIQCPKRLPADLAVVVDNSGSEDGFLQDLKDATHLLLDAVEKDDGRASLVRVSTHAEILEKLSEKPADLREAVDSMFVSNGWTALYDGIRVANETLGAETMPEDSEGADNKATCGVSARRGIVVFTDGEENNSNDEHATAAYPGDGVHTTLDDLGDLRVRGVKTPIYTVGLGDEVDQEHLQELANASGGRHNQVDSSTQLSDVFYRLGRYLAPSYNVCGTLPRRYCGRLDVRLNYSWSDGDHELSGTTEQVLNVPCAVEDAKGRVVTMLLALQALGDSELAAALAREAVSWVSPVAAPRVLLVRDDSHHGEHAGDVAFVSALVEGGGFDVTVMDEPKYGLQPDDVADFDVVWFSNPGYPMDDEVTFQTLLDLVGQGGGVILQGDDMSYSFGESFSMEPLTGLVHHNNGTSACGKNLNGNGKNWAYRVGFADAVPVPEKLRSGTALYRDDIDHSELGDSDGVAVWAFADVVKKVGDDPHCDTRVPVVVAHDLGVR